MDTQHTDNASVVTAPADTAPVVVRLEGITKSFGPVRANRDITLNIKATRILALLGENGAGKSTLMSILAGKSRQDCGTVYVDGNVSEFKSPKDALDAGIGMVYQHFMLVDSMTVAENIFLGQVKGWLNNKAMHAKVRAISDQYGLTVDPGALISDLSMGERQRVEILKLLLRDCRVLILDEPTAVLTPPEITQLFAALRRMAAEGKALVFISHKMQEVLDLANDIAILRKGEIVDSFLREAVPTERELASRMIGRDMLQTVQATPPDPSWNRDVVISIEGLTGETVTGLDLQVKRGGITAIAGVAGNGQRELVEVLAGLRKPARGKVNLLGKTWADFYSNPPRMGGMGYIPEDRKGLGTCPTLNLVNNFLLTNRHCFTSGPFLNWAQAYETTAATIKEFDVQPGIIKATADSLSGGNLQKLVVGREFYRNPEFIIAENPTQGLDISAMEEVWRRLLAAREHAGILLVTGDLNEALTLADTIAVMYRGRFMGVIDRNDEAGVDRIGLMMAGISE